MNRRSVLAGFAFVALSWLATGCDRPEQVQIILAEPHATEPKLAEAERVLEGVRVRLREQGYVQQQGTAPTADGEVWLWDAGRPNALEVRVLSVDDGITITLRQVTGERGAELMGMLNKLSDVASACMTNGASRPVSPPAQP